MEWLAAKDWNEGQKYPGMLRVCVKRKRRKEGLGWQAQRETKSTSRQRTKGSSKEGEKEWKWKGYSWMRGGSDRMISSTVRQARKIN